LLYWLDRPPGTKPPLLYKWWVKANQERVAAGRSEAVILFKRTGKRACILMDGDWLYRELVPMNGPYSGMVISLNWDWVGDAAIGQDQVHHHVVVIDLDYFLDWCTPATIKQLQVV